MTDRYSTSLARDTHRDRQRDSLEPWTAIDWGRYGQPDDAPTRAEAEGDR